LSEKRQIPRMRAVLLIGVILTSLPVVYAGTALDAVKELPKEQLARIARIEAREGTPEPERWYILTQDPAADTGVHEFVVSNGEIVASRAVSQFAESLKEDEVVGAEPLKIDSDKAAKLARAYAEANGAVITNMNYELKKDGPDAVPAWTVWCLDDKGNKLGEVVVTAEKGNVVSHEGFTREPEPAVTPGTALRKKKKEERHVDAPARLAPVAGGPSADEKSPPRNQESGIGKTFDNVGRTLHKYLPF